MNLSLFFLARIRQLKESARERDSFQKDQVKLHQNAFMTISKTQSIAVRRNSLIWRRAKTVPGMYLLFILLSKR
jgi:hypothetical protein